MTAPKTALLAWRGTPELSPVHDLEIRAVPSGLINQTYWLERAGQTSAVLQRLNTSIFDPKVNRDIAAVTERLQGHGVTTPELVSTAEGDHDWTAPDGSTWRVLTYVGERSYDTLPEPALASEGMRLVARWHAALEGFDYQFQNRRPDPHDTHRHMGHLAATLSKHSGHRLYEQAAPLGARILKAWDQLDWPHSLPPRIIHGDLKISNLRFSAAGQAVSVIDLDSVGRGRFDAEIGDALRSWCNPAGEDTAKPRLDMQIFEYAMAGYRTCMESSGREAISQEEWESAVVGWSRITLELSSRFLADSLNEDYFGWSKEYGGHGEHSLLRGMGQLALYQAISAKRGEAERLIQRLL